MNIDSDFVVKLSLLILNVRLCIDNWTKHQVVIAGGCIRDMLFDKPIADIDVFYTGEMNVTKLNKVFGEVNVKWTGCETYEGSFEEGYKLTNIITTKDFPVPIQLIQVKGDIKEYIQEFPCSNGHAYLERGKLVIPIEVIKAEKEESFYMYPCSDKYKNKIKEKYSDFQIEEVN